MNVSVGAPEGAGLMIVPFKHGPFWNFSYLLICSVTREAAVIDPAWEVGAILAKAARHEARIGSIILTHGHGDHVHGTGAIVSATGARVVVHEAELPELRRSYDGPVEAIAAGIETSIGTGQMRLLPTPGHTEGSISVLTGGNLFSGDALHVGALGRLGADPGALQSAWRTVDSVLRGLPDNTLIRPGHDAGPSPTSMLGEERARLPALRAQSFRVFEHEVNSAWRA